jgi:hypothetical protein
VTSIYYACSFDHFFVGYAHSLKSTIMKFVIAVLLPAVVSAAALESRQAQSQYKFTAKELKPQIRSTAKRTLTRIGPLHLLPGVSHTSLIYHVQA